ncbi:MAG TPA: ADOP family duplicated permease [Gemmatimonadales bacterium]|jgi:predicted permease
MREVSQHLRVALRQFRRQPAFVVTAVLVLGAGIGMASAMFTVFDGVLRQRLPIQDQDRVILPQTLDASGVDLPLLVSAFTQVRAASRTMSTIAGVAHQGAFPFTLLRGDGSITLNTAWVTGNFFDVLGARPALGRLFNERDESLTEPSVMVISYDAWQRQFGGDSAVLGAKFRSPYSLKDYSIVGVAPPGLAYPAGTEYWFPLVYGGGLNVLARLNPGATPAAARDELRSLTQDVYRRERPDVAASLVGSRVRSLPDAVLEDVRPALRALTGVVALLLLLACVNVGNLILLRVTARHHEIAVRRSLGASAGDVMLQVVMESAVLAAAGGVVGLTFAVTLLRGLWVIHPAALPRIDVLSLGHMPLFASIGLALGSVVLIGVVPAFIAAHGNAALSLRGDTRSGGGRGRRPLRQWLVGSEIALALIMVTAAGLVARSLERLYRIDLGYSADHLALLSLTAPVTKDANATFGPMLDQIPPGLHAVPGVAAVTPLLVPPFFGPGVYIAAWEVEGQAPPSQGRYPRIPLEAGGPEYFRTLNVPLLKGRGFLPTDGKNAPSVAVVSVGAARVLGMGSAIVGRRIRPAGDTTEADWRTVIGVAGDIHYRTMREATPSIFLSASQFPFLGLFAVRLSGPLDELLPALRRAVHAANPAATIARAQTMDRLLDGERAVPRLSTVLLSGFGGVALLLAAIGLYGLMSVVVREQTREIGVRMALGATAARVRRDVLRRALGVTAAGAATGILGALIGARLLASLLFEVSPSDPLTLIGAAALLLAVGLLAAYLPARRATLVDPAVALRSE